MMTTSFLRSRGLAKSCMTDVIFILGLQVSWLARLLEQ